MTIKIEDIAVGDVVAEMHLHQTNFGVLKGWEVSNLFEISEEMYQAMQNALPSVKNGGITDGSWRIIGNKFARVVSIHENFNMVDVSSVLVIYSYDHRYYVATLASPLN